MNNGLIKGGRPSKTRISVNCPNCGHPRLFLESQIKRGERFCSKECSAIFLGKARRVAIEKRKWSINSKGYLVTRIDGKHVAQHRYVVEQSLGRKLKTSEHVHHVNGIKTDNRLENLKVIDSEEHNELHAKRWKQFKSFLIQRGLEEDFLKFCEEND